MSHQVDSRHQVYFINELGDTSNKEYAPPDCLSFTLYIHKKQNSNTKIIVVSKQYAYIKKIIKTVNMSPSQK